VRQQVLTPAAMWETGNSGGGIRRDRRLRQRASDGGRRWFGVSIGFAGSLAWEVPTCVAL
jgi:hypothetical protein